MLTSVLRLMIEGPAAPWLVPCLCDLAENALARGQTAEAETFAHDALLASEKAAAAINRFRALDTACRTRLAVKDVSAAGRYAEAATVLARELGEPYATARAALASAAYRRASGDPVSARRILEAALADVELVARPTIRGLLSELRAALVRARAADGDRAGAEALLARARADAPRADVRARRHLESVETRLPAAGSTTAARV